MVVELEHPEETQNLRNIPCGGGVEYNTATLRKPNGHARSTDGDRHRAYNITTLPGMSILTSTSTFN